MTATVVEHIIEHDDFVLYVKNDSTSYFEGKKLLDTNPSFDQWLTFGKKCLKRYSWDTKLSVAISEETFEIAMRTLKKDLD